ncbi:MAG TPA: hypothetical protein VHV82_02730 [Sporichthyaceae bacterium]|jgi:hypothetical protein|nr:hypothetical protein [Sporichthyaceae bacterium]
MPTLVTRPVTVYFVRDSHVVVQVNLTTQGRAGSSRDSKAATRRWTESMIARMAAAAADDRMEPWFYRPLAISTGVARLSAEIQTESTTLVARRSRSSA